MNPPRATYRLQFHRGFPFEAALPLVPYLADLGISHVYASPILMARTGSPHGYDVIDPTRVNPELGGEEGLRELTAALRQSGLGLIVDIVPNHMAVGGDDNPWWLDVLEQGPASPYAGFFDIDWHPGTPGLEGKLLAPFLGRSYGEALAAGEIRLVHEGRPALRYFEHLFPLRPEDQEALRAADPADYEGTDEAGRARLHALLERQHYRLAWWRTAADEINWRRFFDINGLAGLRVEKEAVFEATHATLLRLYREGIIDGLRVDHVDGLADPEGYCRRLRARLDELQPQRPDSAPRARAYLVVEKILGPGEILPQSWEVDGSSGYDFMDQVSALQHDPEGEAPLTRLWVRVSGRAEDFHSEERQARREILERSFSAQLEATVTALHRLALASLETRDRPRAAIRRALIELLTHYPVYRSYATPESGCLLQDREFFDQALAGARRSCRAPDRPVLDLLQRWLAEPAGREEERAGRGLAMTCFQQLSAPLAAKAVEDTAFYRYGRLLSRNDVGFAPGRFADSVAEFHRKARLRLNFFPDSLLATATHDHKRGEDLRARLAVLSEIPEIWVERLDRWLAAGAALGGPLPSAGDQAILYQMLVGAWPPDLDPDDAEGCRTLCERLTSWQEKALREAKLATAWDAPNRDYEAAAAGLLQRIFAQAPLRREIAAFARRIAPAGAVNSLVQVLLKMTVPGVPDFFQGTELWDFSLVDPDNRRPVDFTLRQGALTDMPAPEALQQGWKDGRIKQAVIARTLDARRRLPRLFAQGRYEPLQVEGPMAGRLLAFARHFENSIAIGVVSRRVFDLLDGREDLLLPEALWDDTIVRLDSLIADHEFQDVLAGRSVSSHNKTFLARDLLARLPVALLVAESGHALSHL